MTNISCPTTNISCPTTNISCPTTKISCPQQFFLPHSKEVFFLNNNNRQSFPTPQTGRFFNNNKATNISKYETECEDTFKEISSDKWKNVNQREVQMIPPSHPINQGNIYLDPFPRKDLRRPDDARKYCRVKSGNSDSKWRGVGDEEHVRNRGQKS